MDRKLAAILAADVVGYSALMECDEAGTHERLKAGLRELFEPEIARHHGRIFKLMGDGMLAEFASAVDAVEGAVALQRGLAERNAAVAEDQRIQVRMGINLGDVIVEGDDRYGEGVNIAARLEQLAEPGGIYVSGKVAKEVEKKLAFGFESLGEHKVKNIAEPVPVYRVRLDDASGERPRAGWHSPGGPPSLAVLPFVNLSGDPAHDCLGLGVADDLIIMLSTSPALRVVSRQSSFVFNRPERVQAVASALGVDYVVEGSVKKSATAVRIAAQLIDGRSGESLWAERFEAESGDVAGLQEAVATRIYATLGGIHGEIRKLHEAAAWSKPGPSFAEYDYHMRGVAAFFSSSQQRDSEARRIWREGLAKFPDSALLRLEIAATYYREVIDERTADPWAAVQAGWSLVHEADAMAGKPRMAQWLDHYLLAVFLPLAEGDFEAAAREAEAAHRLVPYDPFSHANLSNVMTNAGRTDRAIEWAQFAVRTEAIVPDWYRDRLAWAYYHAGRPSEALAEWDKMAHPLRVSRAAALARLGRLDEARALTAAHVEMVPTFTIAQAAKWPGLHHPQMVERLLNPYLADLAKAGLPEK
jgi:class 3 adenylate cyclase